jgi:hypothetical protein
LAAKVRAVRFAYQRQESPRQVSLAEESFIFWLYLAWGNAIVNAGVNAEEKGETCIGKLPQMEDVVSYDDVQRDIPNLTTWEFMHIRPMVRVYAAEDTFTGFVIHQGMEMIRIGQMGTVLSLMRGMGGDKKIRIPMYDDENGARVIFRHEKKWAKAYFFSDLERE